MPMCKKGAKNEQEMSTGEARRQRAMGKNFVAKGRKFVCNRAYAHPEAEYRNSALETLAYFCRYQVPVKSI